MISTIEKTIAKLTWNWIPKIVTFSFFHILMVIFFLDPICTNRNLFPCFSIHIKYLQSNGIFDFPSLFLASSWNDKNAHTSKTTIFLIFGCQTIETVLLHTNESNSWFYCATAILNNDINNLRLKFLSIFEEQKTFPMNVIEQASERDSVRERKRVFFHIWI